MKKLFFFMLVLSSLLSLSSCKRNKYFVPLGNLSSSLVEAISSDISMPSKDYFTSNQMSSGELFKIVDSNGSYVEDNKTYSFYATIEKADAIIISIGLMDILPSINVNIKEKTLEYDDDFISRQLEILDYHLIHIVDSIRLINYKCELFLLGAYSSYEFDEPEELLFSSIITRINRILIGVSEQTKAEYISLLEVENQKDGEKNTFISQVIAEHYER